MERNRLIYRVALGSVALVLWFFLFSAGLLIETVEQRCFCGPTTSSTWPKRTQVTT